MNTIGKYALGAFVAIGGISFIAHIALKHVKDGTKAGVIWLAKKYPVFRTFLVSHGQEIVQAAQDVAEGIKEAEEEEQGPQP